MRGKAPHSGIGLSRERQDLPSLPEICGAEHEPLFARRGLSTPGEQHAGIIGLDRHAARIGQRPFLFDAQGPPGFAQIVTGKHFACCAGVEALGLRRCDRHGVNVRIIQTRLEVRPRIPTVHAAEDAINFHPSPDNTMIIQPTSTALPMTLRSIRACIASAADSSGKRRQMWGLSLPCPASSTSVLILAAATSGWASLSPPIRTPIASIPLISR